MLAWAFFCFFVAGPQEARFMTHCLLNTIAMAFGLVALLR
jgi:hypothetical protein